jgi:hypothetical protein
VPHRPGVDHLAEVFGRHLERLAVSEKEAHSRDRLVVADRRLGGAVLVAEPSQVAADELPERRLPIRLVLHSLPDDPGGLAERQGCASGFRTARPVNRDELTALALLSRRRRLREELELEIRHV